MHIMIANLTLMPAAFRGKIARVAKALGDPLGLAVAGCQNTPNSTRNESHLQTKVIPGRKDNGKYLGRFAPYFRGAPVLELFLFLKHVSIMTVILFFHIRQRAL